MKAFFQHFCPIVFLLNKLCYFLLFPVCCLSIDTSRQEDYHIKPGAFILLYLCGITVVTGHLSN